MAELIKNAAFVSASRGDLLSLVSEREPSWALSLARDAIRAGGDDEVTKAAFCILLRLSPDDVWPQLRASVQAGQFDGLFLLGQLYDNRRGSAFREWPAERLCELALMLASAFPATSDPRSFDGRVTPENQCRRFRDAIPFILFDRNTPGDRALLNELAGKQPQWKAWHDWATAGERVKEILGDLQQFLPLETVIDALANADYRFVRNADDLIEVINEQLDFVIETIQEDVQLVTVHTSGSSDGAGWPAK